MALKRIVLFDIDGTLTKPRKKIQQNMKQCLKKVKNVIDIGYVGGSDAIKIKEQLDQDSIALNNYLFSENGLVAMRGSQVIGKEAIKDYLGEDRLKRFVNYCLHYIADLDIPIKRGTFIEYRTGLINISPIGRNCSQLQRQEFQKYDHQHHIRKTFIQHLEKEFADLKLKYSIGGQISFDVFPLGWDKGYCLRYLKEYDEIYFLGDKTQEGGNDYEIYTLLNQRAAGKAFSVKHPQHTIQILTELFLK